MGDDTYIVGMYALSYVCVDHNKNDTYIVLVLVNVLSYIHVLIATYNDARAPSPGWARGRDMKGKS